MCPELEQERDLNAAQKELLKLAAKALVGQEVTWEEVRDALMRAAQLSGEWAGYPMPVDGMSMEIHPSYPFATGLRHKFHPDEQPDPSIWLRDRDVRQDVREDVQLRNSWRSHLDGRPIVIWRKGDKFQFRRSFLINHARMILDTLGAARAWDIAAEQRALEALRHHVSEWAFNCYSLTGTFLESSKKSGVIYMFRRLRPTIAMTSRPDYWHGGNTDVRILTCLCAHPIGWYHGTWAGAMVPTDDVISHLLIMRADEHLLWKQCHHIPALSPEAGL